MGKTLFETFFELAENDGDAASTPRGVEPEALKFARAAAISTPEPTTPPGGTGESDLWSTLLPPPIARLPLFRRADTSPKSGFATDSPEGGAGLFVALAGVKKQGKQAFVTGAAAEELNQAFRAKIWAADASKGRSRFHLCVPPPRASLAAQHALPQAPPRPPRKRARLLEAREEPAVDTADEGPGLMHAQDAGHCRRAAARHPRLVRRHARHLVRRGRSRARSVQRQRLALASNEWAISSKPHHQECFHVRPTKVGCCVMALDS